LTTSTDKEYVKRP